MHSIFHNIQNLCNFLIAHIRMYILINKINLPHFSNETNSSHAKIDIFLVRAGPSVCMPYVQTEPPNEYIVLTFYLLRKTIVFVLYQSNTFLS